MNTPIKKNQNWLWIGGWASCFSCWKDRLQELYPTINHYFMNSMDTFNDTIAIGNDININSMRMNTLEHQISFKNHLQKHLSNHNIHRIYAWSLGSLLMHHFLSIQTTTFSIPVISIAPIFEFCKSKHNPQGWPTKTLKHMRQGIINDKNTVLKQFWKTMINTENSSHSLSPFYYQNWIAQATQYTQLQLIIGLNILEKEVVNPSLLKKQHLLTFWLDLKDTLSSFNNTTNQQTIYHNNGHLPFLKKKF